MKPLVGIFPVLVMVMSIPGPLFSAEPRKTRDEQVVDDRKELQHDANWVYNDLEKAREVAQAAGKPMLIVFRCIP